MRKLIVNTFVSLDGVMQAPGGPEEDPTGGFTLGGWSVSYWDDEMMDRASRGGYELLVGRGTYEIFVAHWPYDEGPIADHLNATRKYVASTTLEKAEWNNAVVIDGDVADYVAKLKAEDGPELQVHGSPGLIQTLLENDLVDEFNTWIFPVLVGSGKRLFGEGTIPVALQLTDSVISKTGVAINTYARAGEIEVGEIDFEEPTEEELARRERIAEG